jgi:hypothetical protein
VIFGTSGSVAVAGGYAWIVVGLGAVCEAQLALREQQGVVADKIPC